VIWFHAASLGEFEQGRPLIEKIKKTHPEIFIVLSFFSPSGYELRKNYDKADYVCYLPADTQKNAQLFLTIVNPKKVYFIKYEFWFNYIKIMGEKNIPLYLISGIFSEHQVFFKFYAPWFVKQLKAFRHFFVQNTRSVTLLKSLNFDNVSLAGDTRFDRVIEIAESKTEIEDITHFVGDKKCLVIGSSWSKDEDLLCSYINSRSAYKYIIAPHEIHSQHISSILSKLKVQVQVWSRKEKDQLDAAQVLIIDQIGMLSSIYRYADVSYVGGAFGLGLHNILEPAVYGIPVIFGPKYKKFQEAKDLLDIAAVCSISTEAELQTSLDMLLTDVDKKEQMGRSAKQFIYQSRGAVNIIFEKTIG
jgi:3-deoxy-D-manno-octulosonic-acid transferase